MYYHYFDKKQNRLKNYYKLLNISRDCSDELIHQHYQTLYESGKTTEAVEEAYSVLSKPEGRARYNRVYDRYNWDYGLQKNTLYENAKPKNHGRMLFIVLLVVLTGFSAIAIVFFRTPEAAALPVEIEEPVETQPEIPTEPVAVEPESEPEEEADPIPSESEPAPSEPEEPSDTVPTLFISEEILAAYPDLDSTEIGDNAYPTAQVTAGVNFRNAPSMDSTVLSALGTNEPFSVLGKIGGWAYIHRETEGYGWIGRKYIYYTE